MKRRTVAVIVSASMVFGAFVGTVSARTRWTTYRDRNGNALVVRTVCLSAEDSAAHLRLRSYEDGRIVYGCERRGY